MIWLCGACFKTHSLRSKCWHDRDNFVAPLDCGDGVVLFILFDLPTSSATLLSPDTDVVPDVPCALDVALLDLLLA